MKQELRAKGRGVVPRCEKTMQRSRLQSDQEEAVFFLWLISEQKARLSELAAAMTEAPRDPRS